MIPELWELAAAAEEIDCRTLEMLERKAVCENDRALKAKKIRRIRIFIW